MISSIKATERLKSKLLGELHLMKPADLGAYWSQAPWSKPDLTELVAHRSERNTFAPLAYALMRFDPSHLASASRQPDPFGSLLETVDLNSWITFCLEQRQPWMVRVWLACASQLRAERRLIFKAHGWGDTWEALRQSPDSLEYADELFFAQLRHAKGNRQVFLLALPELQLRLELARRNHDNTFLRRFRRAKTDAGMRAGVALAAKFIVQHWLELPLNFPGLCFFSHSALDDLLAAFGLSTGGLYATKQLCARLGLIQAGAKRHFIEEFICKNDSLVFGGSSLTKPYIFRGGKIEWGSRLLWRQSS